MFSIWYEVAAEEDLGCLRAYERRRVLDEIDRQLRIAPTTSTSRRKLLSGIEPPWNAVRRVWQLRVGDLRVFYDVDAERREVVVRAVRRKGGKSTKEIL